MQQPWPAQSIKGFLDLLPGKFLKRLLFLKPNPRLDATILFKNVSIPHPKNQDTSLGEPKAPQASTARYVAPWKKWGPPGHASSGHGKKPPYSNQEIGWPGWIGSGTHCHN